MWLCQTAATLAREQAEALRPTSHPRLRQLRGCKACMQARVSMKLRGISTDYDQHCSPRACRHSCAACPTPQKCCQICNRRMLAIVQVCHATAATGRRGDAWGESRRSGHAHNSGRPSQREVQGHRTAAKRALPYMATLVCFQDTGLV